MHGQAPGNREKPGQTGAKTIGSRDFGRPGA